MTDKIKRMGNKLDLIREMLDNIEENIEVYIEQQERIRSYIKVINDVRSTLDSHHRRFLGFPDNPGSERRKIQDDILTINEAISIIDRVRSGEYAREIRGMREER